LIAAPLHNAPQALDRLHSTETPAEILEIIRVGEQASLD
jgi:hypothetical protein